MPKREPKFHHDEMFEGAGRSMNALLIIFISGCEIYIAFILSTIFVIGFVGFSSKPSPIYGGLGLIVSGGVGCGIVLNFGGSFLGLMVFLIYLGGMLVVFGYTTAMATEMYPEV